ncbi:MAG: hypothetical protein KBE09_00285 [Candidatus Pacebacteria bacterium]|nr:hypothetical protein [Candidatus Paceibacterota bacterium]
MKCGLAALGLWVLAVPASAQYTGDPYAVLRGMTCDSRLPNCGQHQGRPGQPNDGRYRHYGRAFPERRDNLHGRPLFGHGAGLTSGRYGDRRVRQFDGRFRYENRRGGHVYQGAPQVHRRAPQLMGHNVCDFDAHGRPLGCRFVPAN